MFVATSLIWKLVRKTWPKGWLKCKATDKIRFPNKGVEFEFLPRGLLLGRTVRKFKINKMVLVQAPTPTQALPTRLQWNRQVCWRWYISKVNIDLHPQICNTWHHLIIESTQFWAHSLAKFLSYMKVNWAHCCPASKLRPCSMSNTPILFSVWNFQML